MSYDPGALEAINNFSDVASIATALSNLGIANLATLKTTVNLKSGSSTIIYQPSGSHQFVPLIIVSILNTASGLVTAGVGTLGTNGGADFFAAQTMPSVVGKYLATVTPSGLISVYTNASPLYYNPTVQAVATTLTADFYVFGLLN